MYILGVTRRVKYCRTNSIQEAIQTRIQLQVIRTHFTLLYNYIIEFILYFHKHGVILGCYKCGEKVKMANYVHRK